MDFGQVIRCHRQDDLAGGDAGYDRPDAAGHVGRPALALDPFPLGALDGRRPGWVAGAAWRRRRSDRKDVLAPSLAGHHVYRRGRLSLASRLQIMFSAGYTPAELESVEEPACWSMLRADDVHRAGRARGTRFRHPGVRQWRRMRSKPAWIGSVSSCTA
ncbi:hypothetical protein ABMY26_03590 [Azospirillum sp. HJ39]|uniref:hypothetical protein n=1 Tax=Azospirillum sp. HJ39 TaxID=3159496 RepID=UPI003556855E